jgi:hypothetical protein
MINTKKSVTNKKNKINEAEESHFFTQRSSISRTWVTSQTISSFIRYLALLLLRGIHRDETSQSHFDPGAT